MCWTYVRDCGVPHKSPYKEDCKGGKPGLVGSSPAATAEAYVLSALVVGEVHYYCGAARGTAAGRIDRIKLGIGGTYLRPKGEKLPGEVSLVSLKQFHTFEEALCEEAAEVGWRRGLGQHVRGACYANVKLSGVDPLGTRQFFHTLRATAIKCHNLGQKSHAKLCNIKKN